MKLTLIPAGSFEMGSDETDKDAGDEEKPKHSVRLTKPFYLGTTEVTVGQFRFFVADSGYKTEAERDGKGGHGFDEANGTFAPDPKYTWRSPGFAQTDDHPVVNVSWNDAVAFCEWLTKREPGTFYRLPTEAEWEYACRGGTTTRYANGDDAESVTSIGNIADGTLKKTLPNLPTTESKDGFVFTAPVGRFKSNGFGLFDMHGNVWEWCSDGYDAKYYSKSPTDDPAGVAGATSLVNRGGGWFVAARDARSATRSGAAPGYRLFNLGFRVARVQSGR